MGSSGKYFDSMKPNENPMKAQWKLNENSMKVIARCSNFWILLELSGATELIISVQQFLRNSFKFFPTISAQTPFNEQKYHLSSHYLNSFKYFESFQIISTHHV